MQWTRKRSCKLFPISYKLIVKRNEYIDKELSKIKGESVQEAEEEPDDLITKLQKDLYSLPEEANVKKQVKEDDVALATGMLAVPEVDLGVNAKVKNIVETERAIEAGAKPLSNSVSLLFISWVADLIS